ncbi:MAG: hypothetical protein LBL49_10290 [Clostridiales Family XIII bacterium]|nr:hypothetical protein [Clostridiales Family XIII bacterium]
MDYEEFCGLKPDEDDEPVEGLTAYELKAKLDAGEDIQIIDIRESHERSIVKFPNAKEIPIEQLARRINEFDQSIDMVFLCKIGQRSVAAIYALRQAGYKGRMFNLLGGVNAWVSDIDGSIPIY